MNTISEAAVPIVDSLYWNPNPAHRPDEAAGHWSTDRTVFRFWFALLCARCGRAWQVRAASYREFAGYGCPQCGDKGWHLTRHGAIEGGQV